MDEGEEISNRRNEVILKAINRLLEDLEHLSEKEREEEK